MTSDTRRLILSTDYELFFDQSGSVQRCVLEPTERLLQFLAANDSTMTFYVDTGMLLAFDRFAAENEQIRSDIAAVREQLRRVAAAGHELGLHIHPHWQDTRLENGQWQFGNTRYKLDGFTDDEVAALLRENFAALQALTEQPVVSYRAGGFCIEPFQRIAPVLKDLGIRIDSSVVPGAVLVDDEKGFDFSAAPHKTYWEFDQHPATPVSGGEFCEVAVTPIQLGRGYFWGRLIQRFRKPAAGGQFGDGRSKAIGKTEVLRRLVGRSLTSELSMDHSKAPLLASASRKVGARDTWHVMGHPKLLSERSLQYLSQFMSQTGAGPATSVAGFAAQFAR